MLRNFFLFLSIWTLPLSAEIVESNHISDLLISSQNYSKESTWILCDLDNTLITAAQHFGGVKWCESFYKQLVTQGVNPHLAYDITEFMVWTAQPMIKMKTIEEQAPSVINELQNKGFILFALTARHPREAYNTEEQLSKIGIHFDHQSTFKQNELKSLPDPARYIHGIIYTSPFLTKSEVLLAFLHSGVEKPKRILFIDDKWGHVRDLETATQQEGIEYLGIRYGGADELVASFNPEIAELQWKMLPNYLSNEEAALILNEKLIKNKK